MRSELWKLLLGVLLAALPSAVWGAGPAVSAPRVVATTTIVADVVQQVAGDRVQLDILLPVGADPHSFEPNPADAVLLARADVVVAVGAGLEESLQSLLRATGARVLELARAVPLLAWRGDEDHHHGEHPHDDDHQHGAYDPHVWMDPGNVGLWTHALEEILTELDPAGAEGYAARAAAYREQLRELDRWIEEQVERIPHNRRLLVADHRVLGYFAHRYGFREIGTVIPAASTLAEPSPRDLEALVRIVRELEVPAVFVGTTVSPALAETVARDGGAKVVRLYTESLSSPSGPASTYVELMRYNVGAIVDALESR